VQLATVLKKALVPLLGVSAVGALILQARAPARSLVREAAASAHPASQREGSIRAEGRVVTYPGSEVTIGTDRGGTIARVLVEEKSRVRRGDLLIELESSEARAALAEARAKIAEATAEHRFLLAEAERQEQLALHNASTPQARDRARHELAAAEARRATAEAATRRLAATLARTRIVAPIDGVVLSRLVQPGETVAAGAPLLTIADLTRVRIEAEVDEFDAAHLENGMDARVMAEGWNNVTWRGRVEDVPDAVTGRRLKPQDPGKPSDTRVLLVKIALSEKTPLKLGQRVEAELQPTR
jgi:RND family efflux transporter MFP subunit